MKKLDYSTFGKFEDKNIANKKLIDILFEIGDKALVREVSSKIKRFDISINSLDNIDDCYEFYLMYAFVHMKNIINETKFPEKVKSLTLNLICAKYKMKLKKYKLKTRNK